MAQHQDARRRSQEERRHHPEAEGTCCVAACLTHGRSHTRLPPPMEEVRVGADHAATPGHAEPEDRDAGGARERERRSPNPEKRDGEANHQEPRPDRAEDRDVPRWIVSEGMGREEQRHSYRAGHAHDPSREQELRGAPSSELDVALDGVEDSGPDAFSHLGGCVLPHRSLSSPLRLGHEPGQEPACPTAAAPEAPSSRERHRKPSRIDEAHASNRPQRSRVRYEAAPGDMPVRRVLPGLRGLLHLRRPISSILRMGFFLSSFPKAAGQRRTRRRRRAFPITETELRLIAAAASIGLRRMPRKG